MARVLISAITAFTGIARMAGRKARRAAGAAARQCCQSAIATGIAQKTYVYRLPWRTIDRTVTR